MSFDKRIENVEDNLTPKEAVIYWMRKAHQCDQFYRVQKDVLFLYHLHNQVNLRALDEAIAAWPGEEQMLWGEVVAFQEAVQLISRQYLGGEELLSPTRPTDCRGRWTPWP